MSERRDQAYYWTDEWQADEREAVAEIERGEAVKFANGTDAARWLSGGRGEREDKT